MSWTWLPNALTLARCSLAFAVGWSILTASNATIWLPLTLFAVTASTDFLDGYLARRLDAVSAFGARLDPIADKLLVACGLLAICLVGGWPLALTIPTALIVGRDIAITALREAKGHPQGLAVTILAKVKTTGELVAVGVFLAALAIADKSGDGPAGRIVLSGLSILGHVALWGSAFLSVVTGLRYWRALRHPRP